MHGLYGGHDRGRRCSRSRSRADSCCRSHSRGRSRKRPVPARCCSRDRSCSGSPPCSSSRGILPSAVRKLPQDPEPSDKQDRPHRQAIVYRVRVRRAVADTSVAARYEAAGPPPAHCLPVHCPPNGNGRCGADKGAQAGGERSPQHGANRIRTHCTQCSGQEEGCGGGRGSRCQCAIPPAYLPTAILPRNVHGLAGRKIARTHPRPRRNLHAWTRHGKSRARTGVLDPCPPLWPGACGPIIAARRPSTHPTTKRSDPPAQRRATTNADAIARSDAEAAGRPTETGRGRLRAAAPPRELDPAVAHHPRTGPAAAAARPTDAALTRTVTARPGRAADARRRCGARPGVRGRCQQGLRQPPAAAPHAAAPRAYRPAGRRPPPPAGCPKPRPWPAAAPEPERPPATVRPRAAQAEAAAGAAARSRCHFRWPPREQPGPDGAQQVAEPRIPRDMRYTGPDASAR